MKKLFVAFALVAFAASFTSCKKCGKCVYSNGTEGAEFCQNDSKIIYDAAKKGCNQDPDGSWE